MVTNETSSNSGNGVDRHEVVRQKTAALSGLDPDLYPNVIELAAVLATCVDRDPYYRRGIDVLVRGTRDVAPARPHRNT